MFLFQKHIKCIYSIVSEMEDTQYVYSINEIWNYWRGVGQNEGFW